MATILKFPDAQNVHILAQDDADDLFAALNSQNVELSDRLEDLSILNPTALMRLTVHDYHLLVTTLLMACVAAEHRIAVLDQRLLDLEEAVFGGEE